MYLIVGLKCACLEEISTAGFHRKECLNIIHWLHRNLCLTTHLYSIATPVTLREADLRFSSLLCLAFLLPGTASAQSLSASGVAGYLSEWQLSAKLSETPTTGEFTGPLNIKHIGLCTHDGPDEIISEINLRIADVKPWFAKAKSEIKATFILDGSLCTLTGTFSGTYKGYMDCANTKGVPVTLSVK